VSDGEDAAVPEVRDEGRAYVLHRACPPTAGDVAGAVHELLLALAPVVRPVSAEVVLTAAEAEGVVAQARVCDGGRPPAAPLPGGNDRVTVVSRLDADAVQQWLRDLLGDAPADDGRAALGALRVDVARAWLPEDAAHAGGSVRAAVDDAVRDVPAEPAPDGWWVSGPSDVLPVAPVAVEVAEQDDGVLAIVRVTWSGPWTDPSTPAGERLAGALISLAGAGWDRID
jgi:hypothetical protein